MRSPESPPEPAEREARRWSRVLRSRILGQTIVFSVFTGLVSLLSAVAAALLARNLSTDEFGAFSFALSLLMFGSLFFDFGLFPASARVMATAAAGERRSILAASLIAYAPVGAAFTMTTLVLSFAVDSVFHIPAGEALRVAAPFAFAYPFFYLALWLAQGLDRLHVYSISM